MYTLMETCLDRLDIFEFLSHVEDGLKDHYDIKVGTRSHDLCLHYDVILDVDLLVVDKIIKVAGQRSTAT